MDVQFSAALKNLLRQASLGPTGGVSRSGGRSLQQDGEDASAERVDQMGASFGKKDVLAEVWKTELLRIKF